MKFVPENEAGVIICFAQKIMTISNISIVSIRIQYPDAILRINEKEVRTEFEYLSSNFIAHQHDPRECDLIVCWIDDVSHHNKLPTWELSRNEWLSLEILKVTHSQKEALYWEGRARRAEKEVKKLSFETVDCPIDRQLKKQDRLSRIADLAEDHTQPEIADILGVSLSTIKRDIKQLNGKLEG